RPNKICSSSYMTCEAEARVTDVTSPCKSLGAAARLAHITMHAKGGAHGRVELFMLKVVHIVKLS
ncbi:hypothetical protein L195_g047861, partial [Trifolium pratense]